MPKYVAFLRAINVGGHTVKMDQLRSLFEELSFANVETFIASGNVIFDSKTTNAKSLERKIEKHLKELLGYEVTTFVRSVAELAEIARYQPFSEKELTADGNTLFICFVADRPAKEATKKLLSLSSMIDAFHVNEREVYWLYRRRNGESKFYGPPLEKTLGSQTTVRNSNTIKRLVVKYSPKT
ncbi:MAG TPA: DUF1697 domain-containing protein [Pyrinomonadaceae bacterium]|jgi:uncharacterized protein (DUF1697 family)|nr:DUF1697 domain-containing protein [Pyrinomonadaceae bacterium]